jgi:hypothetical protein
MALHCTASRLANSITAPWRSEEVSRRRKSRKEKEIHANQLATSIGPPWCRGQPLQNEKLLIIGM